MKSVFPFAFILIVSSLFSSCKFNPNNSATNAGSNNDSLSYKVFSLDTVNMQCKDKFKNCPTAKIKYPIFNTSDNNLNVFLNAEVSKMLLTKDDTTYHTVYSLLNDYFNENNEMKKQGDYDDENAAWENENTVSVKTKIGKYISLCYYHYAYTGGAHEVIYTEYKTFDLDTKKEMQVTDFIDTTNKKLLKTGEKYFRINNNIPDTTSLADAGFFIFGDGDNFEDGPDYGKFHFNNNFSLTKEGIEFFYNAYDIAPFSAGTPFFTIPYNDLQPYLRLKIW